MDTSNHPYQWTPKPHTVFRDPEIAQQVHEEGFVVRSFLNADQLGGLRSIYANHHNLTDEKGGMFYSVYSQDVNYRQHIHDEVHGILRHTLEEWFTDYKNVINSFVVKLSGEASEFAIHQDTTALNEFEHSPLSVWIPLVDIDADNGALCLVRKSHHLFSPYRGISFPFPFSGANEEISPYLEPIYLKAGEALIFDPRVLHNSMLNTSNQPRPALICGIFPREAQFEICYKAGPDEDIEVYRQEDDFLIQYPNFLHHCHDRPVSGAVDRRVPDRYPRLQPEQVANLLATSGAPKINAMNAIMAQNCNMIGEPDHIAAVPEPVATAESQEKKVGFWNRIFGKQS